MDQHKLRTLVFEKTGVRIDIDDPIFALVALNEAVLAEAVERHVALLDDATADLEEQVQLLQDRGSICNYAGPASPLAMSAAPPAAAPAAPALQERRTIAIAGAAALLCAALVLIGQAMMRPASVPPPSAPPLTAEQSAALRDGEKLARIVSKLDAKTRSIIDAEMAKP